MRVLPFRLALIDVGCSITIRSPSGTPSGLDSSFFFQNMVYPRSKLPELDHSGGQFLLCSAATAWRILVNPQVLKIIQSIDKLTG